MDGNSRLLAPFLCAVWLATAGCAATPYQYGRFTDSHADEAPRRVTVEYGKPNKTIDRMSDALTWPCRKLAPHKPDKRIITAETTATLRRYLEENDLADVHVAVRQYSPRDQWRRLRENKHLGPIDRYTFGVLTVLHETIFPAPVFNRNAYNPYTNTLHVNLEEPGFVLCEAAFAKNVRGQRVPGIYLLANEIPLVAVWPACDTASELVGYAREKKDWELEKKAYLAAYPGVGAEAFAGLAAAVPPLWPFIPLYGFAGHVNGNSIARTKIARREKELQVESDDAAGLPTSGVQQASFSEPVGPGATSQRLPLPTATTAPSNDSR